MDSRTVAPLPPLPSPGFWVLTSTTAAQSAKPSIETRSNGGVLVRCIQWCHFGIDFRLSASNMEEASDLFGTTVLPSSHYMYYYLFHLTSLVLSPTSHITAFATAVLLRLLFEYSCTATTLR